jgi:biopolymer transport protein ExbD
MTRSLFGLAALFLTAPLTAGQEKPPPVKGPVLILTMRPGGAVKVYGPERVLQTPQELRAFLAQEFKKVASKEAVQPTVILRAPRDSEYKVVYSLLQTCSDAGFRKLTVRALTDQPEPKDPQDPTKLPKDR